MPEPSPMTKPSRSRLKGLLAFVGSPFEVLRAVSRLKPVMPSTWIMVCVPPVSITSASPRRMMLNASPIACVLAAHAVRQLYAGPRMPNSRARCASGMLGSCSISRDALIRRSAASTHRRPSTLLDATSQPARLLAA